MSWKMAGESRYLFYGTPSGMWYIAAAKTDDPADGWYINNGPFGDYAPLGTHTGTAIVEAII